MTLGEETDQYLIDYRILTDNNFFRFSANMGGNLADIFGNVGLQDDYPFSGLNFSGGTAATIPKEMLNSKEQNLCHNILLSRFDCSVPFSLSCASLTEIDLCQI
jgi:hypothetical protein